MTESVAFLSCVLEIAPVQRKRFRCPLPDFRTRKILILFDPPELRNLRRKAGGQPGLGAVFGILEEHVGGWMTAQVRRGGNFPDCLIRIRVHPSLWATVAQSDLRLKT